MTGDSLSDGETVPMGAAGGGKSDSGARDEAARFWAFSKHMQISLSIDHAILAETPVGRVMALRRVYELDLIPAWTLHVSDFTQSLNKTASTNAAAADSVRNTHQARSVELDAAFERERAQQVDAPRAKATEALAALVTRSNAVVRSIWQREKQLELEPLNLSDTEPAKEPEDHFGGGRLVYLDCKAAAEALRTHQSFGDDFKALKSGWIAGAALVIGWILFGSFGWGIFIALWAGAGMVLFTFMTRNRSADTCRQLLLATQCMQAAAARDYTADLAACDKRKAALAGVRDAGKSRSSSTQNAQLSEIDAALKGAVAVTRAAWQQAVAQCRTLVARIDAELASAITTDPLTLAPLEVGLGHARADANVLALRIGTIRPQPLATLPGDLAKLIDERVPTIRLANGFPAFWDLAAKQALIYADEAPARSNGGKFLASMMARIIAHFPPGKVKFTLFDTAGLGHNFGGFLKLGDYSKDLIGGQAWSDREHLRARLKGLIAHIETVTQKYLRNDFPDIERYNAKAGKIAEAYQFLVIADFPERFDEEIARDLDRIVQNGPRCGVFTLLHLNGALKPAYGTDPESLRSFASEIRRLSSGTCVLVEKDLASGVEIDLDAGLKDERLTELVSGHGESSVEAMKVEVPYAGLFEIAHLPADQWWQKSSKDSIEVPLGPKGANEALTLRLGVGMAHHALIVGRPGSGKSNLLHVLICMVARLYSPEEVQLYLIDFKKGVEFKAFADAQLPHARVIAVESEREFGLSVLRGLDDELKRRGTSFRDARATAIAEYRRKTGQKLPRIILIVDEFQEFFAQDDRINREAQILFDRLVKQGRAFGIHIILGTQSLANAGLPSATRDQMAIRIALQSSAADSALILGDNNMAARMLSRPGEAVYNDQAGQVENNEPFQVAMFNEADRDRELTAIVAAAKGLDWQGERPTVFEGHEPAQLEASAALSAARPVRLGSRLDMWLGEPVALRPAVAAPLKRQAGRNMLVLGKEEDQAVGVMTAALCALAAQSRTEDCSFRILDYTSADADWADHPEEFAAAVPHEVQVGARRELKQFLKEIAAEVTRRNDADADSSDVKDPSLVLAILGLHRIRDIRPSEGMSSLSMRLDDEPEESLADQLRLILRDGPDVGVHTLIWCDSYANMDRALDRGALGDISLRVSGPLSNEESHRMFDSEAAAGIDKPFRMIKFDDDQVGVLEPFRPYALPSVAFIRSLGVRLSRVEQGDTDV